METRPFDPLMAEGETPAMRQAREKVLAAAREYYELRYAGQEFTPGKTFIPSSAKVLDFEDLGFLLNASLDLWLTAGRFARAVESELHQWANPAGKAILVNSGSSANLIAIASLGSSLLKQYGLRPLEKGDEVITLAAGFPTTVSPIVQNGWKPVFIDVDSQTLNALPEAVMAARAPRTRAVVLAHTLGNPFRADVVADWCQKEGLFLIEDSCDALGSRIGDRWAGSFGQFSTLSFYPAHHITCGEGGAVICQNARLKRVAESLRDWGRDCWCEPGHDNTCGKRFGWQLGDLPPGYDHKFIFSQLGYNLKLTDMQAALLLAQMKKLPAFIEARKRNWNALRKGLDESPWLKEHLQPVEATAGTDPSWFGFAMHCSDAIDREKMLIHLNERRIGTRLLFAGNLLRQPGFRTLEHRVAGDLSVTDRVMRKTFWIATYPGLDDRRMAYMLECLEQGIRAQVS